MKKDYAPKGDIPKGKGDIMGKRRPMFSSAADKKQEIRAALKTGQYGGNSALAKSRFLAEEKREAKMGKGGA